MAKYIMSPYLPHASPKKDGSQPSHRAGWALMYSKQLNAPLIHNNEIPDDCDTLYIEPGMEFSGELKSFNMALSGKMWNGLYKRMKRIADFVDRGGKIITIDHTIDGIGVKDWGERLYSRKKNYDAQILKGKADSTFGQLFPNDVELIKRGTQAGTPSIHQKDIRSHSLTLGDSHALSAWVEGSKCSRNDGLTLNGAINRGFDTYIDDMNMDDFHRLRLYMGNIDLRHHLCRINNDLCGAVRDAEDLARRYVEETLRVKNKYGFNYVEIVEMLPVEHEARRLPKTGFYKGQPFWGSAEDRMIVRDRFNEELERQQDKFGGFRIIEWPSHYKHCTEFSVETSEVSGIFKDFEGPIVFKPGMLRFDVMEKPHSVHVAPSFYLWEIV